MNKKSISKKIISISLVLLSITLLLLIDDSVKPISKQVISANDTVSVKKQSINKKTIKNFLKTGLTPVGHTMYIWGGGWNKEDTGAGIEARTIGESKKWNQFFQKQTSSYNYKKHLYEIHNGLDCSGFVGWVMYNTMNTASGKSGYVMSSTSMAKTFASKGFGTYVAAKNIKNHKAGDIMSTKGHVYIVIGECSDKSIVTLEATPPGVRINGTPTPKNKSSEAMKLAQKYMKKSFPKWYKKYPSYTKDISYLKNYNQMRWKLTNKNIMSDPDGFTKKDAKTILKNLFGY